MSLRRNLSERQKVIAGVVVAVFVFVIFYAITVSIQRAGKIKTTIKFAPYTATIKLNDTRVANNATVWLEPGNYHLTVDLNEHLESYQEDITISESYNSIIGTLGALDEEGEKYISAHTTDYTDAEGYISKVLNQEGDELRKKYPILKYLPLNNSLYSISYTQADDNHPIVHVKAELKNLDIAVAKLRSFEDVNISTLDLIVDTKSPFEKITENPLKNPVEFIKAAYKLSDNYVIYRGDEKDGYYYAVVYKSDYK